jgi:hypothetical protein
MRGVKVWERHRNGGKGWAGTVNWASKLSVPPTPKKLAQIRREKNFLTELTELTEFN